MNYLSSANWIYYSIHAAPYIISLSWPLSQIDGRRLNMNDFCQLHPWLIFFVETKVAHLAPYRELCPKRQRTKNKYHGCTVSNKEITRFIVTYNIYFKNVTRLNIVMSKGDKTLKGSLRNQKTSYKKSQNCQINLKAKYSGGWMWHFSEGLWKIFWLEFNCWKLDVKRFISIHFPKVLRIEI